MDYRVSVLQYEPKLLDKQKNLLMLREMLCELDTDLVVLPELCTTGYLFPSREALVKVSEEYPSGAAFETFSEIALNRQMSIVYGFSELSGDTLYNSCALINPDGSHHLYRKTHLFDREKLFFTLGDTGFNVFTAKGGVKIGMMICFDWQFPEAARTLAMKGAQILCHPSNLVLPWCQQSMLLRSLENRVFSITSNRIGSETTAGVTLSFTGQSQILGTKGEILCRMTENEIAVHTCTINPDLACDKSITANNDAFADRRPEFYEL